MKKINWKLIIFVAIGVVVGLEACSSSARSTPTLTETALVSTPKEASTTVVPAQTSLAVSSPTLVTPLASPSIFTSPVLSPTATIEVIPTQTTPTPWNFHLAYVAWESNQSSQAIWAYSSLEDMSTPLLVAAPGTLFDHRIQLKPGGEKIGYLQEEANGTWAIWELDIATKETMRLTSPFTADTAGVFLGWAPGEEWIYVTIEDLNSALGNREFVSYNLGTGEVIEVGLDSNILTWSPTVENRFFEVWFENGNQGVQVHDLNGEVRKFESPFGVPYFAVWGANEQEIIVAFSETASAFTFFSLNLDSEEWHRLLTDDILPTNNLRRDKWLPFSGNGEFAIWNLQELTLTTVSNRTFINGVTPTVWLDTNTILVKSGESFFTATFESPELVEEIVEFSDLHPNLDPLANVIGWIPQ